MPLPSDHTKHIHMACFTCATCKCKLQVGKFAEHNCILFCVKHKPKGSQIVVASRPTSAKPIDAAPQHYQAAYKFANIAPHESKYENQLAAYTEITVPLARVFELNEFFTANECQYYIQEAEKTGFESLSAEYPEEYRNNERYVRTFL